MEDNEILDLYRERNQRAVIETNAKYGGYCGKIAMNILHSREDAEECVNDTFLKAWNTIPPTVPEILSAFLGRITRNISFNRYKAMHAGKRGGGEMTVILDEIAEIVSGGETPEDALSRRELSRAIGEFLEEQTAEKRGMFIRRYWYSDSISVIAKRYKKTENTVSVTLNRLRKQLRGYLTERGFNI
ncbi:MAG: sigma-70 family RNA polymerase sigma factor [Ruminococcus sp.]|nr:sigma-70 family RNA polymerase sigma factor [Ruminococcus sp.]